MLESQGRMSIGSELIERCKHISINAELNMFYNQEKKALVLKAKGFEPVDGMYFVASLKTDDKGRITMPLSVRKAFPDVDYLPTERNGEIYIFIIT